VSLDLARRVLEIEAEAIRRLVDRLDDLPRLGDLVEALRMDRGA